MKISSSFVLATGFGLIVAAVPVFAHHSFAAQYDRSKPNAITGPVTKIDWINPHARFFMDVKDDSGKVVSWEVELGPPAGLMRRGWTRNSLLVHLSGLGRKPDTYVFHAADYGWTSLILENRKIGAVRTGFTALLFTMAEVYRA